MEKSLDQREYETPSKREEVVMDDIWKVFQRANPNYEILLSIDQMKEVEQILFNYKHNKLD